MPFFAAIAAAMPVLASIGTWLTTSFLGKALVSLGLSFALNALANAIDRRKQEQTEELTGIDLAQQAGALIPRQILIGEYASFGHVVYQNMYGANNEYFEQVILMNDWYSESLSKVYLNGQSFDLTLDSTVGAKQTYSIDGAADPTDVEIIFYDGFQSAADADLVTNSNPTGKWDSTAVGVGLTYIIMRVKYRKESAFFKGGVPRFKYVGKWSLLYDWRLDTTAGGSGPQRWATPSTWVWDDNPVVATFNYHRGFWHNSKLVIGQGLAVADLVLASYTTAADACEDAISLDAGGTEDRYRLVLTLSANRDITHASTLDALRATYAGYIYDYAGYYYIQAGVNLASSVTITDDDLDPESSIMYAEKRPRNQLGNVFYGGFLDAAAGYEAQSYAEQRDETSITAYGEEIAVPHELLSVPSQFQAERIARIRLRELNNQHTASVTLFSLRFLKYQPGDWITWRSLLWRIADKRTDFLNGKIVWSLEGTSATVHTWATTDEGDVPSPPAVITIGTQISTVVNFQVNQAQLVADFQTIPGLIFTWDAPGDDTIESVVIEFEEVDGAIISTTIVDDPESGTHTIYPVAPGKSYRARATITTTPVRTTTWTSYDTVTSSVWTFAEGALDAALAAKILQFEQYVDQFTTLRDDLDQLSAAVNTSQTTLQQHIGWTYQGLGVRYDDNKAGIEEVRLAEAGLDSAMSTLFFGLFAINDIGQALANWQMTTATTPEGALAAANMRIRAGSAVDDVWAEASFKMTAWYDAGDEIYYSKIVMEANRIEFIVDGVVLPASLLVADDTPYPVVIDTAPTPDEITVDLSKKRKTYKVIMTSSAELQFPSNADDVTEWDLLVEQDATGGRSLTLSSDFIGTAPTIGTAAEDITWLKCKVLFTGATPIAMVSVMDTGNISGGSPSAGSIEYTVPGTYQFVVPSHTTMTFTLYGPGGSGGDLSSYGYNTGGGETKVDFLGAGPTNLIAGGGGRGKGTAEELTPAGGTAGTASGGDTNTAGTDGVDGTGQNDSIPSEAPWGDGADAPAPDGGVGGIVQGYNNDYDGNPGNSPGGGGSAAMDSKLSHANTENNEVGGGGGASGALCIKTLTTLSAGITIDIIVGEGGQAYIYASKKGGVGGNGLIRIEWS